MKRYSLENQVRITVREIREMREKHGQSPRPYSPIQRKVPKCSICFFGPQAISLPFLLEKAEQPGWSRSLFSLLIHLPPQQILIDLLLCTRHCSRSWRFSTDQIHKAPQDIVFSLNLAPRMSARHIPIRSEIDLNRNGQSADRSPWAVHYLDHELEEYR